MPQERLPLCKIAASLGITDSCWGCIRRARRACLSWPLPPSLDDETLESRLYPPPHGGRTRRVRNLRYCGQRRVRSLERCLIC
jgi:hypothetical protein